jgi:hypothetical protein
MHILIKITTLFAHHFLVIKFVVESVAPCGERQLIPATYFISPNLLRMQQRLVEHYSEFWSGRASG